MKKLLGIDVGTTSVKAGLYDEKLNEIASYSVDYTLISSGDRVEFDADEYINLLLDCIDKASAGYVPDAIAIDTQCETLILADENGVPLRNAIVWLDNRASEEAEEIEGYFGGEKIYTVTGQPQTAAAWPACKLLWLRKNEPDVFANINRIFLLGDWLVYKLTGNFVTEGTIQSSSLYFDINTGDWWDGMLEFVGISRHMLPCLLKSTDTAGKYKSIPVIMGAMDQIAGAVGAGAVLPGIVTEMTGTTLAVFASCKKIPPYQAGSVIPCHYNYNGSYCRLMWTSAAGLALKWFKNEFCESSSFRELDGLAERVLPGAEGVSFVPHLCGSTMPVYDPSASAAFCGVRLGHSKAHFIRAVMESVAFMLKECLDCIDGDITEIRSSGGGANSALWCGIKADVTGKTIATLTKKECATLGSAIFAGVGIGAFGSVEEAAKMIETGKRYFPAGNDYSEAYERYRDYCRRVNPADGGEKNVQ